MGGPRLLVACIAEAVCSGRVEGDQEYIRSLGALGGRCALFCCLSIRAAGGKREDDEERAEVIVLEHGRQNLDCGGC
jgi:hypothetical protein